MRARDNPYSVQRIHRLRYRLSEFEWQDLIGRFEGLGHRAALVGQHGRGKSTLLAELGTRFADRGWRLRSGTLRLGDRRLSAALREELLSDLGPDDLILLDGAEQLPRWRWRAFFEDARPAGGLLVTSHREGLLPTLRHCRTTPTLLAELILELHGDSPCTQPSPQSLFDRFDGDLREVFRALYDLHAHDRGCAGFSPLSAGSRSNPELDTRHPKSVGRP